MGKVGLMSFVQALQVGTGGAKGEGGANLPAVDHEGGRPDGGQRAAPARGRQDGRHLPGEAAAVGGAVVRCEQRLGGGGGWRKPQQKMW